MKRAEWIQDIDSIIKKTIKECFEGRKHGTWNENFITGRVLSELEKNGTETSFDDMRHRTVWQSYKLSGTEETQYGDIALLVTVWLTPTEFIEGVAFFEAKRLYHHVPSNRPKGFDALDDEQLKRLNNATPISRVLLYAADPHRDFWQACSLPTIHAMTAKPVKQQPLYLFAHGTSWAWELTTYLLGIHLDYSKNSVQQMKSYAEKGGFSYVMNIATTKNPNVNLQLDDSINFSLEYETLDYTGGPAPDAPDDDQAFDDPATEEDLPTDEDTADQDVAPHKTKPKKPPRSPFEPK